MTGPNDRKGTPPANMPDPIEGPPPEDVLDPEDWGGPLLGDLDDREVLEPKWLIDPPPTEEK